MDRARSCDRRSLRSSGCTLGLFIRGRCCLTTWSGAWCRGRYAWCCRRDGLVTRLRHSTGIGWIENVRRQRRWRRYIARLCLRMFDQEAGANHDAADHQDSLKSPCGHCAVSERLSASHIPTGPNSLGSSTRVCSRIHIQAHRHISAEKPQALRNTRTPPGALCRPELASR